MPFYANIIVVLWWVCIRVLVFNAAKSKCMLFLPRGTRWSFKPVFTVNGQPIEYVQLGHVTSSDLDDARDIDKCRLALIRQINNVLC